VLNPDDGKLDLPGRQVTDSAYGYPAKWIDPAYRAQAEDSGYHVFDCLGVIHNHFYVVCTELAGEILSLEDVRKLLDRAAEYYPELVAFSVPKVLSEVELFPVLQRLLAEDVPINNLDVILQTMLVHIGQGREPIALTERVRRALARAISARLADRYRFTEMVPAIALDAELGEELRGALRLDGPGPGFVLTDERREQILAILEDAVQRREYRPPAGRPVPPVMIVAPDLRPFVFDFIHKRLPLVPVICREELVDEMAIDLVETIGVLT